MEFTTKHFGTLEVNEDEVITFDLGLPGFPEDKKFIIIIDENAENKFYCWLQSMDNGDVSLVLIDSFAVMPEYDPLINEEEIAELGDIDISDLLVFNVAVIGSNMADSTINLKAPVVINNRTKKGKQIVVNNENYSIRHNLEECIKNEGKV
ncbi:MAG: flagellar assembly protein FliW [Defluviitaleaceae bacterium]|nr:flagellar assembly protein FliW [Defluviitaleaceae bacterium]